MSQARHLWHKIILTAFFSLAVQPSIAGESSSVFNSSLLGALAHDARYEKAMPEFVLCPLNFGTAHIVFDEPVIKVDGVDKEYVRKALSSYLVINGCDWENNYSQTSGGVSGYLELADRTRIRWLVKAGGLALLLYPDGGVVYLARELTTNWKTVASAPWARVQVERKFYEKSGSKRFFVHVLLTNTTGKEVTFDAAERTSVFYPNQWVESSKTSRQIVDEIRPVQSQRSKVQLDALIRLMNKHKIDGISSMITIKARDVYDYFISFNSGSKSDLEQARTPYVIVVMDGDISLTDGSGVKRLSRDSTDFLKCEVPVQTPIKLSPLPKLANVLFED